MARRSRRPFQLGLDPTVYNSQAIQSVGDEDLKREYARLRREANDRLYGLRRSKDFFDSQIALQHYGLFRPIKGLSRSQLESLTVEAARFVQAEASSASGQASIRRKALATLHISGYNFVNTRNYKAWWHFMEWFRGASNASGYRYVRKGDEPGEVIAADTSVMNMDELKDLFEQWSIANGWL